LYAQPPHSPANRKMPYDHQQIWLEIVNTHIDKTNGFTGWAKNWTVFQSV